MDLILERVQSKFACIIGELCSEPVVLSKFAIWLDLRLCEYKLKGAISLDCSGETPDPSWLKGHEKPLAKLSFQRTGNGQTRPAGKVSGPRLGPKMGPRSVRRPRPEPVEYEDTSSMEPVDPDVVVKEEPLDHSSPGLFPVGLTQSNQNRKRSAAETLSKSVDMSDASPAKMGRTEAGSNQSLLSLIGNSDEPNEMADSDKDFKVEIEAGFDDPAVQLKEDEESIAYSSRYSSSGLHLNPHSPSSADDSSSAQHMTSFQSSDSFNLDQTPTHQQDGSLFAVPSLGGRQSWGFASRSGNGDMSDIRMPQGAISACGKFHRWLEQEGYTEKRPIQQIPPEELEKYLVHFFGSVTKNDGHRFQSTGYRELRKYLQYYLKLSGYPESITQSPIFQGSKDMFRETIRKLKLLENKLA